MFRLLTGPKEVPVSVTTSPPAVSSSVKPFAVVRLEMTGAVYDVVVVLKAGDAWPPTCKVHRWSVPTPGSVGHLTCVWFASMVHAAVV